MRQYELDITNSNLVDHDNGYESDDDVNEVEINSNLLSNGNYVMMGSFRYPLEL